MAQVYTHKHHIVPRHMGGTDDKSNLVELTIEDHAIAHKVLYGLYGREEDKFAWLGLSGMAPIEELRREIHRYAVRKVLTGRAQPKSQRENISKALTGRKLSDSHRKAMMGKRPHVNQSGANNNNAKPITTPHGEFETSKAAADFLGKSREYVRYRLYSDKYVDWQFIGVNT